MTDRDHTPRHRRHCQQCDAAVVGDERHMILKCPAVQHIRDQNPDLFWDGQSMREFVRQTRLLCLHSIVSSCQISLAVEGFPPRCWHPSSPSGRV